MIQILLILAIIICLIILLLKKKKEHFYFSTLPLITSLKAIGGNGGIKLTWIKPYDNIDRYYIILKFNRTNIPKYYIYLYDNNNDLLEFHIKNIPNDYIYNVYIIYKFGADISEIAQKTNIITDAKSLLNFIDNTPTTTTTTTTTSVSNTNCNMVSNTDNTNMELKDIMNLLKNRDISDPSGNYNVNIY